MNARIKMLRKTLDLTQQEFGDRIGIKRNSVALIENGRNTSDQTIFAICREFNVNEAWLRTGEGDMFQKTPESELDALVKKYGLSDGARILIEKFVNLKPDQQNVIINFMKDAAVALAETGSPIAGPGSEIDIDAEVESYRRALELQRRVVEESSASSGPGDAAASKIS